MATRLTFSPSAILIIETRADAERFLAAPFEASRIVCLTPVARTVLEAEGWTVESCSTRFGDFGHRRGLARCRRIEHYLDVVFRGEDHLHAGSQEALRQSLLVLTAVVSRTWHTIGSTGPWVVYDGGTWRELADRWEATALLLRRFRPSFYFARYHSAKIIPSRGPSLFALLNWFLARLLRGTNSVLIVKPGRGMKALGSEIRSISGKTIILSVLTAKKGFKAYLSVLHNLKNLLLVAAGNEAPDVMLVWVPITRPNPCAGRAIETCLEGIPDRLVRQAALLLKDDLITYHSLIHALSYDFKRFLGRVRPRSAVLWSMASGMQPAIAWAAERQNIPCWMLSHVSLSCPKTGTTGQFAAGLFAKFMGVSELTHGTIAQSPAAQSIARHAVPGKPIIRCQPVVWKGRDWRAAGNPIHRQPQRDRVILFVGNFNSWHDYRPWVMETADEVARSIEALARVTATIDRCRLIIRCKAKPELDKDAMEFLVRDYPNCEIHASEDIMSDAKLPSLDEAIAEADITVGFSTTVVEEAVHAGCPVLLWGGRQRYQHLPARFTPPSHDDRSAVYSVKRGEDPRPMLEAILDAHEGDRLSEAEILDYCWPRDVPGVSGLAQMLFDGADAL